MLVAALLVPAHIAAFRRGDSWLAGLLCADIVALTLTALAARSESLYASYAQEDGVIEWATTFGFLAAAVLCARRLRRPRSLPLLEVVVRVGFIAFCVLVAGEEISWGQRLFGFQPPEVFLERNFQQELNIHNVLMDEQASGLGFELDSKYLVMAIAIVFGVFGPLLVRLKVFRPVQLIAPPLLLAPAFLAVVVAQKTYPVDLTGEGAEMLLAFLFVIAAAFFNGPRIIVISCAAVAVAAAVTAPLLSYVVYGSDEDGLAKTRDEIVVLIGDLGKSATEKLSTRPSIHKRVYTAMRDGYFDLADSAFVALPPSVGEDDAPKQRERRRYFLDPWNNPYWVSYDRESKRLVVYSFGPNRRRDTDIKKRNKAQGDDVMAIFSP